ncbi:MAG: sporulation protein YqfD [Clostridia bacterium]|nr:sporulation protein YqfD [Clostridia bacterium]
MWHFCRGYVIIQIEGDFIASYLRSLSNAGVPLWNVRRMQDGSVLARIPSSRFRDLKKLNNKRKIRVHIVHRGGLPFLLRRMQLRPVLLWGGIASLIAMFVLSRRIWLIRIEGNARIESDEILALLSEHSLTVGSVPEGPVLITASNDLSARIRDAAWIGLDREGITLKVTVKEARPISAKKTDRVPYDVRAEKDGVVTRVSVMRGQAAVKPGDRVKQGDVLISGTVRYKDASYETSADGVVYAAIRYEANCIVPTTVREANETGNTETVCVLRVGPWEVFRSKPSFELYRMGDFESKTASLLLPVYTERATAYELVLGERSLEQTEAEELAFMRARELAFECIPKDASILNQYASLRTVNGVRTAFIIITAEEIIGRTEEVPNDG